MKRVTCIVLGAALLAGCHKPEEEAQEENQKAQQKAAAAQRSRAESERAAKAAAGQASAQAALPPKPAYDLGKVPVPDDNPMSDKKVELGHLLFFDKRLSADNSRSCYSCHQNEDGNGGKDPIAIGAKNKQLTRHSPVIWNVGYLPKLYWDGRSDTLEAQGTAALAGGNMGVGKENLDKKAEEIGKIAGYKKRFDEVFPGKGSTPETIVQALSAYERTLVCDDTAYDRYAKGDPKALSDKQKQGLELFTGKAACITCHTPPYFSLAYLTKEGAFFNVGVGIEGKKEEEVDVGRMAVTKKDTDWAAFKPPSLRNVSKSPPYFHDGSKKTLSDAVHFMAGGGFANKNRTPLLTNKELSEDEIGSIIEFLKSLDCGKQLEQPKKLP
jgi:cytochrome c peroxidase